MNFEEFLKENDPEKVGLNVPSCGYMLQRTGCEIPIEQELEIIKHGSNCYLGSVSSKNRVVPIKSIDVYADTGEAVAEADLQAIKNAHIGNLKFRYIVSDPVIPEISPVAIPEAPDGKYRKVGHYITEF